MQAKASKSEKKQPVMRVINNHFALSMAGADAGESGALDDASGAIAARQKSARGAGAGLRELAIEEEENSSGTGSKEKARGAEDAAEACAIGAAEARQRQAPGSASPRPQQAAGGTPAGPFVAHGGFSSVQVRAVMNHNSCPPGTMGNQWGVMPAQQQQQQQVTVARGLKDKLTNAVESMAMAYPPQPFLGKYILLMDRVLGRQALINFAVGCDGSGFQYAIKCDSHSFLLPAPSAGCAFMRFAPRTRAAARSHGAHEFTAALGGCATLFHSSSTTLEHGPHKATRPASAKSSSPSAPSLRTAGSSTASRTTSARRRSPTTPASAPPSPRSSTLPRTSILLLPTASSPCRTASSCRRS
jgi:hypothetical protein